jgi:hypothetical protein
MHRRSLWGILFFFLLLSPFGAAEGAPPNSLEYDHAFIFDRTLDGLHFYMETKVKGQVPFALVNGRQGRIPAGSEGARRKVFDLRGQGPVEVSMEATIKDGDEVCTMTASSPMEVKITGETQPDPRGLSADRFIFRLSEEWNKNYHWTVKCQGDTEPFEYPIPAPVIQYNKCPPGTADCKTLPLEFEGVEGSKVELPLRGGAKTGLYRFILHLTTAQSKQKAAAAER